MAKKFEVAVEAAMVHGNLGRVQHEVDADGWEVFSVGENRVEMLRLYISDGAERRVVFATPLGRLLWISEVDAANE